MRRTGRWLHEEAIWTQAMQRTVRGHLVGIAAFHLPPDFQLDRGFLQVELAMDMLARYTPFIEQGIRRREIRILLDDAPWPAFWIASDIICLPAQLVSNGHPVPTACMIVHEWTHSRVSRATSYPPSRFDDKLAKEEAICVREQRDFLLRVPDTEYAHKAKLFRTIDAAVSAEFWKPLALQKRLDNWKAERRLPEEQ